MSQPCVWIKKHARTKVLKNAEPWVEDCRSKRAVSDCPASMNGGTGAQVLRVNRTSGKPNRWNFARKSEPKIVWCFFVETSDLSTQLARERSVSASSRRSHHAIHTKILTNWRRTSDHRGAVGWERETLNRLNKLEKVETLDFSTDRQGFNRPIFHQSSQKRRTNCQTTLTVTSKREKSSWLRLLMLPIHNPIFANVLHLIVTSYNILRIFNNPPINPTYMYIYKLYHIYIYIYLYICVHLIK